MHRQRQDRSIAWTARNALFVALGLASLCTTVAAQTLQQVTEKDLVGTWVGRYVSDDTGPFEMTLALNAEGKLGGSGWAKGDEAVEPATWIVESVEITADKIKITSSDPSGDVEFATEATLEGSSIKGTYVVWSRVDGSKFGGGTFTGTKKPAKSGS